MPGKYNLEMMLLWACYFFGLIRLKQLKYLTVLKGFTAQHEDQQCLVFISLFLFVKICKSCHMDICVFLFVPLYYICSNETGNIN